MAGGVGADVEAGPEHALLRRHGPGPGHHADAALHRADVSALGLHGDGDHVAAVDVAPARGHVVHDGHLHVEAVAAPLPPLRPRDGELVALLHHAHRDTRPALTGAGHNRHYLES